MKTQSHLLVLRFKGDVPVVDASQGQHQILAAVDAVDKRSGKRQQACFLLHRHQSRQFPPILTHQNGGRQHAEQCFLVNPAVVNGQAREEHQRTAVAAGNLGEGAGVFLVILQQNRENLLFAMSASSEGRAMERFLVGLLGVWGSHYGGAVRANG